MNNARRKMLKQAADLIAEAREIIEVAKEEEEGAFENLPEGVKCCGRGLEMEENIYSMENLIEIMEDAETTLEYMAG